MTDLRTAAQQALEALELAKLNGKAGLYQAEVEEITDAITALRAALVEDAMQKFADVNQELMAALGCDHCNSPLYAAVKCRVCGRVTEPVQEPVCAHGVGKTKCSFCSVENKQPVQEPVAGRAFLERILAAMEGVIDVADRKTDEFDALRSCVIDLTLMLHTAPPQRPAEPVQDPVANDDKVICPACCHQFRAIPPNVQQMMLDAGFEPPFTTPPQRKPLTEEEALDIARTFGAQPWPPGSCVAFARAIEAKHEITS